LHVLREPEELELLSAYSRISDPALKRAVVSVALSFARDESRKRDRNKP
jgi:hypothetical protein